jgi:hypothetical protein
LFDISCGNHSQNACWVGRADALILWRDAPPGPALVSNGVVLGASDLDSSPAAGPRLSLLRVNNCTGDAVELGYMWVGNFQGSDLLPLSATPYQLVAPGIYGNDGLTFDSGIVSLTSRLQSAELNRHLALGRNVRFLAGFRWFEWRERFTLQSSSLGGTEDFFQTNCINNLYGGQIGLDANLLSGHWIRFDSVVKAGMYYNNAVQSSLYTTNDPVNPGTASVSVGESPLSGAFAGEVGFTGVVPLTCCLDFRFGYFALWLSGIAQPTQQLDGQQLTPGQPVFGTINGSGGAFLQGATVGLEARF